MNLINESEIYGKWSPIIESTTGIEDKHKLEWMSKYCHNHELYENNAFATVGSVNGMGATRFPGDPGLQSGLVLNQLVPVINLTLFFRLLCKLLHRLLV